MLLGRERRGLDGGGGGERAPTQRNTRRGEKKQDKERGEGGRDEGRRHLTREGRGHSTDRRHRHQRQRGREGKHTAFKQDI